MEKIPFELTPEQKGMLASLVSETGQPMSRLLPAITEALEALQTHERVSDPTRKTLLSSSRRKRRPGEIAADLLADVPEEVFERLPEDGASQHDHYIYGTPKRPT